MVYRCSIIIHYSLIDFKAFFAKKALYHAVFNDFPGILHMIVIDMIIA